MRRAIFSLAVVAALAAVAALALALSSGTATLVEQAQEGGAGPGSCADGIDNDGDGLIDGADPDCAVVGPLTIRAGHDFFRTLPETFTTVGGIPTGFFGTIGGVPSDAMPGPVRVDLTGLPTGRLGLPPGDVSIALVEECDPPDPIFPKKHCHSVTTLPVEHLFAPVTGVTDTILVRQDDRTDTIVFRFTDVVLPGIGDRDTVETEIFSLSLVTVTPIEVTYGGPSGVSSFFDVFIELNPASGQDRGSIDWTRLGKGNGTFDSLLPVKAIATFTNTDAAGPKASGPVPQEFLFGSTGSPWTLKAVGGTVELLGQSESPGDASESSARDYTAPIAAAIAAGALALAAGGWYGRRRWMR